MRAKRQQPQARGLRDGTQTGQDLLDVAHPQYV
jgi:hypothetical protein